MKYLIEMMGKFVELEFELMTLTLIPFFFLFKKNSFLFLFFRG